MEGSAMPTTVASSEAMPEPRTVAASTQRPRPVCRAKTWVPERHPIRSLRAVTHDEVDDGVGLEHGAGLGALAHDTGLVRLPCPAAVELVEESGSLVVDVVVDESSEVASGIGRAAWLSVCCRRHGEAGPREPGHMEPVHRLVEAQTGHVGDDRPVGKAAGPGDPDGRARRARRGRPRGGADTGVLTRGRERTGWTRRSRWPSWLC